MTTVAQYEALLRVMARDVKKDDEGHLHAGEGPGGGQFVSKGGGSSVSLPKGMEHLKKSDFKNIGAACTSLLSTGKYNNSQIAQAAQALFGSKTSTASVAWYKMQMKKSTSAGKAEAAKQAAGIAANAQAIASAPPVTPPSSEPLVDMFASTGYGGSKFAIKGVPKDLLTPEFASALLEVKGEGSVSIANATTFDPAIAGSASITSLTATPEDITKAKEVVLKKAAEQATKAAEQAKVKAAEVAKTAAVKSYMSGPVYTGLVKKTVGALNNHPDAKKAVADYSDGGFHVNNELRAGQPLTSTEASRCAALDKAFKVAAETFGQPTTLWRKMSAPEAFLGPNPTVGTVLIDNGYVSTSVSDGVWSGSVVASIKCKSSQKGLFMEGASLHSSEREVLLPRGSMFKLTQLNASNGIFEVELEYID